MRSRVVDDGQGGWRLIDNARYLGRSAKRIARVFAYASRRQDRDSRPGPRTDPSPPGEKVSREVRQMRASAKRCARENAIVRRIGNGSG